MMKKSPAMVWIGTVTWIVTALAAINVGLGVFGWNFFRSEFATKTVPWIIEPALWIIGISGVISFIMFLMACSCWCTKCNSSDCGCKVGM